MTKQPGNNSRTIKSDNADKSCLRVVDDASNGLDGEALGRWFAPNALARTLITTHSGEYRSLNKHGFGPT
jgi:hypothetical protein